MKCDLSNKNLCVAKKAKNDEFYTRCEDIENELIHYKEHFKNKTVYCNCNDSEQSEFWKFFHRNFETWGLKRLIATNYEMDKKNYAYFIEKNIGDDLNTEPERKPLTCNGDFRSDPCIDLFKQADIVVTNPPFSLFREYMAQLIEFNKKFLIIGNINAITCKEIFPLLKENKIWLGYTSPKQFLQPNNGIKKFGNILWFTNLEHKKRHDKIDLRGNFYNPEKYPKYDNYDAIEVSKVANIPGDYHGVVGVPITFLDKYCPEQFDILGLDRYTVPKKYLVGGRVAINGKRCYARIIVQHKTN